MIFDGGTRCPQTLQPKTLGVEIQTEGPTGFPGRASGRAARRRAATARQAFLGHLLVFVSKCDKTAGISWLVRDAMAKFVVDDRTADRFFRQVRLGAPGECWIWLGKTDSLGRGNIKVRGKSMRVHRFSWCFVHEKTPKRNASLEHTCRNIRCCNPDHLCWRAVGAPGRPWKAGRPKGPPRYPETLTADFAQLRAKGYSYPQIETLTGIDRRRAVEIATGHYLHNRPLLPQKNGQELSVAPKVGGLSKLNEDAVKAILELLRDGYEISAISKAFGIGEQNVVRIQKQQIWNGVVR